MTNSGPSSDVAQPTTVTLPDGRVIGVGNPGLGQGGLVGGEWIGGVLVPGTGSYQGANGSITQSPPGAAGSAGGAAGGAAGDTAGPTVADQNANAVITQMLDKYGLASLASWAWGLVQQGYDSNYVMAMLQDRPEFQQRFPAIAIRQANGLPPISPADYVDLESQYDQAIHQTGLTGMFNRTDMYTKWIGGDVSASEVHDRATAAYQAAMGEPLDVRAELTRLYGNDASGIATAYFLDPTNTLPQIQQRIQAGEIAGSSTRTGYGLLTRAEAEGLASQGITGQQAQSGFGDLASKQQLFTGLVGQNESDITRQQQMDAEFGNDQASQQAIMQRAGNRVAAVNSGAQYGMGKTGVSGLGSAAS